MNINVFLLRSSYETVSLVDGTGNYLFLYVLNLGFMGCPVALLISKLFSCGYAALYGHLAVEDFDQ